MRARRHTEQAPAWHVSGAWRRFARDVGLVGLTFAVGYAVSSYYVSPASLTGDDQAIPRVIGRPVEQARTALANAGLRSRVEGERPSDAVPRGGVLWQDPPPAMVVPPNAMVQLVVSAGPASATVPDVIGLAQPYAEKIVEAAGIAVGRVDTLRGAGADAGVVIATRPAPGNGRPRGATVDLVVSGGRGGGAPDQGASERGL